MYVGYRYYATTGRDVQFPFGHGLSYTTFELTASSLRRDGDAVLVEATIANTGARDGAEVVQVYLHAPGDDRPALELAGFAKLDVAAGGMATATIRVPLQHLRYYSERHGRRLIEGGVHTLHIGFSSADLRDSLQVELAAEIEYDLLEPRSTLKEWQEHPTGRHLLQEAFTGTSSFLNDPAHAKLVEQIPLAQFLALTGGVDAAALQDLADRANDSR
ncbi:fibronectin type III-like domain-contianing protein [Nonomuraea sp. NPDC046802]|uniref:fibronectin type III-like domain-contianing protein n=1 Tax=Nonomuraea sp. NPDC046802 TaxID=3154919 RepID=UPI0033CCA930